MGYLQKTYRAGQTIEIQKTYSARWGKRITRGMNINKTPEAVKAYNEKQQERELIRKINANFSPGDMYITLTYRLKDRPPPNMADKRLKQYIRAVRRRYKKQEIEFKWISTTAYGSKGGIHHHLILNKIDIQELRDLWKYGGCYFEPLDSTGDYSKLGSYLYKQSKTTGRPGEVITGKRISCSRNLTRPKPEVKEIDAILWREPPSPIKGYLIDVDSIAAGESPVSGAPYLFYRMRKIPRGYKEKLDDGSWIKGEEAEKRARKQNREDIKRELERQRARGETAPLVIKTKSNEVQLQ